MNNTNHKVLKVTALKKTYRLPGGLLKKDNEVRAVADIDITINDGESFGLVGESGCGKSTVARMVLGLIRPNAGNIYLCGQEIFGPDTKQPKIHPELVQMVFQDPFSSLSPRKSIAWSVAEGLGPIAKKFSSTTKKDKIAELLESVGLRVEDGTRYPHQFSGGQRQRVAIARAIASSPKLVVLDEPLSSLDVSIQAQIIELLHNLRSDLGLSFLFISHDLAVVERMCDRVSVMYLGYIVEEARTKELFLNPKHPYTRRLLDAVPDPNPCTPWGSKSEEDAKDSFVSKLDEPESGTFSKGCLFAARCHLTEDVCLEEVPELREISPGHLVRCHSSKVTL